MLFYPDGFLQVIGMVYLVLHDFSKSVFVVKLPCQMLCFGVEVNCDILEIPSPSILCL